MELFIDELEKIVFSTLEPMKNNRKIGAKENKSGKNKNNILNPPNIKKINIPK
tara:strand:+ start:2116 stop:2274 length:159 start_codon:yes stop_codon:yes gene_type:complete